MFEIIQENLHKIIIYDLLFSNINSFQILEIKFLTSVSDPGGLFIGKLTLVDLKQELLLSFQNTDLKKCSQIT